jgi:DNA-binding beta-propeller fold protein YncE
VAGGLGPAAVAVDPTGAFLFSANETSADVSSFKISSPSGTITNIGQVASSGATPMAVAATPSGKLVYVANGGTGTVSGFAYDATGTLKAIPGLGFPVATGGNPSSIAISH